MVIHRTEDINVISRVINDPKIYSKLGDDLAPEEYLPSPNTIYLTNEKETGIFIVEPFNGVTCQVHIAVLPDLLGKAKIFAEESIEWIVTNTKYMKAVAFIPSYNRQAISLALRCGMKREGLLTGSYLKNWKLQDQIILGCKKEDLPCHQ